MGYLTTSTNWNAVVDQMILDPQTAPTKEQIRAKLVAHYKTLSAEERLDLLHAEGLHGQRGAYYALLARTVKLILAERTVW